MALSVGLGYRPHLHRDILANLGSMDFVEAVSDGFQRNQDALRVLASLVPVTTHSLGLSIGTRAGIDYEQQIIEARRTAKSPWHSDHLSYNNAGGLQAPHFIPIVYDDESLDHVCSRIDDLQRRLEVPLALENISAPFQWPNNTMPENEFIRDLVQRTGCRVLLDAENLRINGENYGYRPVEYLDGLPSGCVVEIHIAGGTVKQGFQVDSHDQAVPEPTWHLLEEALRRFPEAAVLLEHDGPVPSFDMLVGQLERARRIKGVAA